MRLKPALNLILAAMVLSAAACTVEQATENDPLDTSKAPLIQPIEEEPVGGGGATTTMRTWWPQPQDGPSYGWTTGEDRGDCLLVCSAGNYNQAFKRNLCLAGKSPGVNPAFFNLDFAPYRRMIGENLS